MRVRELTDGDIEAGLAILGRAERPASLACQRAWWRVRCRCGREFTAPGESLASRRTRSCGCLKAAVDARRQRAGPTGWWRKRLAEARAGELREDGNGTDRLAQEAAGGSGGAGGG